RDAVAPPRAAEAAAWRAKGRAEVREYACAHFDIYLGEPRERSIADQLHFMRRHLAGDTSGAGSSGASSSGATPEVSSGRGGKAPASH
ncbi:MAG: hypothetical protein M3O25_12015, partial [Actinomycetota bacterium]|nr:hypothetical protein [Actinomycetota bacterium]